MYSFGLRVARLGGGVFEVVTREGKIGVFETRLHGAELVEFDPVLRGESANLGRRQTLGFESLLSKWLKMNTMISIGEKH